MSITFSEPREETSTSLACRLGVEGRIKFRTMNSGIQLTFEDNEPETFEVWVAVKPRHEVVEVSEPQYSLGSRFKMVFA